MDLNELRSQVARLQQKIHDRRLGVLIPWVDALRRQLEDRLGSSGSATCDEVAGTGGRGPETPGPSSVTEGER